MIVDLIVYNINELVTLEGGVRTKEEMKDAKIINNGYFCVTNQKFTHIGEGDYPTELVGDNTEIVDAKGLLVTPGLVDPHTHLVHGGSREHELKQKLEGVPYLDILAAGGGILSTVRSTRSSSKEELYQKALNSMNIMLGFGVTTVEAKSGYGLSLEEELKQLEVTKELNDNHPIDLVSTFMGAHAIPTEYKENPEKYIELVFAMLEDERIKELSEFADIFCEDMVFNPTQSKKILLRAKELGYGVKIHADEIVSLGGAELAAEIACVSADHLMAASDEGITDLAKSGVVANILPATSFNLNKNYANARKMLEEGCIVSLSTDYNPGSSPTENMQFVMTLGSTKLRMTPDEVIASVTINAAKAINRDDKVGSIEIGKQADFVIFNATNLPYIMYHFGINHVKDVYKNGRIVINNQRSVEDK